jgi:AcrR family transcriptional regulator
VQGAGAETQVTDRRERLIESAIKLFAAHPYNEVSVQEIAADANVATGLLYYHFTDKQGLQAAALELLADRLKSAVRKAIDPSAEPLDRLRAALEAQLEVMAENPPAYRELLGADTTAPKIKAIVERERAERLKLAAETVPARVRRRPAVTATFQGWLHFAEGVQMAWLTGRKIPRAEIAELCVRVLESSIQAAEQLNGKAAKR